MSRFVLAAVLIGGCLTIPLDPKRQRVGFLSGESAPSIDLRVFHEAMERLGWHEGISFKTTARFAEGDMEQLDGLAAELVHLDVHVIVAGPSAVARAARRATDTIPIVMVGVGDPVKLGLAASLRHPGGNVTGLTSSLPDQEVKSLQLLAQVVPHLTRVAILLNPSNPLHQAVGAETAAKATGLRLVVARARSLEELPAAFDEIVKAHAQAVDIWDDSMFADHRAALIDLAMKERLPTMFRTRPDVLAGGLIGYGPRYPDLYQRAAEYVDKILKGVEPADLPIEQATKSELVINLKTAKTLGLTIAPAVLARADEVIQ